jgi:hypothetical protein
MSGIGKLEPRAISAWGLTRLEREISQPLNRPRNFPKVREDRPILAQFPVGLDSLARRICSGDMAVAPEMNAFVRQ